MYFYDHVLVLLESEFKIPAVVDRSTVFIDAPNADTNVSIRDL